MKQHKDHGYAVLKSLRDTGSYVGLNQRYISGPDQLGPDAREVLQLALSYGRRSVPSYRQLYLDQKDRAVKLGQRYLSEKRIKKALAELKERGFYAVRKESAGPDRIVTLRSYCNLPHGHAQELMSRSRRDILNEFFPELVPSAATTAEEPSAPGSTEPGEQRSTTGAEHEQTSPERPTDGCRGSARPSSGHSRRQAWSGRARSST